MVLVEISSKFDGVRLWGTRMLGFAVALAARQGPDRRQPPGSVGASLELASGRITMAVVFVGATLVCWALAGFWARIG